MKTAAALFLFLVAAYCLYGFIAAGEPGPNHIYFRVGYAVVGLVCIGIAFALLLNRSHWSR
jgi:hypothetical protein